jgi:DNA-binding NarL/FixJ family response regulator
VRVVIGEDQALMREGLRLVLERAGFEIVAVATRADDVVRKALAHRPDLLIADIRMPPGHADDGLRAAIEARTRAPGLPVLVLSQHLQRRYAVELLESGSQGVGYLLKQRIADVEPFVADLHRIAAGGTVLDREVVAAMVGRPRRDDPLDSLTARQTEVLELMAAGRSNAAIAEHLTITEKSVVAHVSRIYEVLGLDNRADDHRRVLAVVRFLSA